MVVTVLVTEEEAAVVVAETARVAEASSASGRGSQCAGGAPMAQTAKWRGYIMLRACEHAMAAVVALFGSGSGFSTSKLEKE